MSAPAKTKSACGTGKLFPSAKCKRKGLNGLVCKNSRSSLAVITTVYSRFFPHSIARNTLRSSIHRDKRRADSRLPEAWHSSLKGAKNLQGGKEIGPDRLLCAGHCH